MADDCVSAPGLLHLKYFSSSYVYMTIHNLNVLDSCVMSHCEIYHTFFIIATVGEHLEYFHFLAIINRVELMMHEFLSL